MNTITARILQRETISEVPDTGNELALAEVLQVIKAQPGGEDSANSFVVKRSPERPLPWALGDRIEISNRAKVISESEIVSLGYRFGAEAEAGIDFEGIGQNGTILSDRLINKRWADTRITNDIWLFPNTNSGNGNNQDLANVRRDDGILIVPKEELWQEDDYIRLRYEMPTGETVKRIKCTVEQSELAVKRPRYAKFENNAGNFTQLNNVVDDDSTTFDTVTIDGANAHIYVGFSDPVGTATGIRLTLGTQKNATASTQPDMEYSDSTVTFTPVAITDGTASGGATLAQSGSVTINDESTVVDLTKQRVDVFGSPQSAFWYRMDFASGAFPLGAVDIIRIELIESQEWVTEIINIGTGGTIASVTSSTTTNIDQTLVTPSNAIEIRFRADNEQIPLSNGSIFSRITSLEVYSETGSITLPEIAKDILGLVSDINSTEDYINTSNTRELIPFYTNGAENIASVLNRAAAVGDQNDNLWYARLITSNNVAKPNGKPVLEVDQVPLLTDFDISIDFGDPRLLPDFTVTVDASEVVNDVVVQYVDENGVLQTVTSDDDSTLKDDDSIDIFGTKQGGEPLNVNTTNETDAIAAGVAYLDERKYAQIFTRSPIVIQGTVDRKEKGAFMPVSEIRPLHRLKIANFTIDADGLQSNEIIGLVTLVTYNDVNQTATITLTRNDDLDILVI